MKKSDHNKLKQCFCGHRGEYMYKEGEGEVIKDIGKNKLNSLQAITRE